LEKLRFRDSPQPRVEVLVVDNDPDGPAAIGSLASSFRWPLIGLREKRRGISYARNAAVREARGRNADFLAFIDDDEVPDPGWLEELVRVLRAEDADVVTGPVLPRFEVEPPAWILRGKFFDRPRYPTGTPLPYARTGNSLVRCSVLDEFPGPFNEDMALSGGSDQELFLRVSRAGYKIVWADDAKVDEWNPASRVSGGWILRRAFRWGNTRASLEPGLHPSFRRAVRGLAKGILLLPLALLRGRHAILQAAQPLASATGFFLGKVGVKYLEYRRTHGD
jgi:GT2 family glycosyltransferase